MFTYVLFNQSRFSCHYHDLYFNISTSRSAAAFNSFASAYISLINADRFTGSMNTVKGAKFCGTGVEFGDDCGGGSHGY